MTSSGERILHVVNWYPNPLDTIEGKFIKDQIDALHMYIPCDVILIQVRYGRPKIVSCMSSPREQIWILQLPLKSWFLKEILSSFALWYFLRLKYDLSKYRMVNFHIAYPLLTYFRLFRKNVKVPSVITEHWSAYHFNFGISRELNRIKKIFSSGLPVITVSQSLAADITRFSNQKLTTFQLPNVVNNNIFQVRSTTRSEMQFFMLGCWQYPKVPGIIVQALDRLRLQGHKFILRIGGYGPFEDELRSRISSSGMANCASFIGKLDFKDAAIEMQRCSYFLHASNYETFSLVCAEALSCGAPVIASAVGGIPEYLHADNGILVPENTVECWTDVLLSSFNKRFDRERIGAEAFQRFSAEKIGTRYKEILERIYSHDYGER